MVVAALFEQYSLLYARHMQYSERNLKCFISLIFPPLMDL